MRRRPAVASALSRLVLACAVAGCGHRAPPPTATTAQLPQVDPSDLPPPDAIPGTFTVRQKLVARSGHGGGSFEAVLQKQPGRLTLVGLTPYGSRAFLLEQEGALVKFTSYLPRDLPFPPAFMLMDIHRAFDASLGPPLAEGQRTGLARGEIIHERWRGGRLVERTFTPAAHDPPAAVTSTITYEGQGPAGLAAHLTLTNHRFGYALSVETIQQ